MRFYIQVDQQGVIRDCIEFPYDGYLPVDIPLPLPVGFYSGYYRYQDGGISLDEGLKAEVEKQNRPYGYDELNEKLDLMQKAIDDIILGGAL